VYELKINKRLVVYNMLDKQKLKSVLKLKTLGVSSCQWQECETVSMNWFQTSSYLKRGNLTNYFFNNCLFSSLIEMKLLCLD